MRDLLPELGRWAAGGVPFALARVTRTRGSAPLPAGSALALAADGSVLGGVSSGCVEAAVLEACRECLSSGTTTSHPFGPGRPDDPFGAPALTCGGDIEVLVHPAGSAQVWVTAAGLLGQHQRFVLQTAVDGPEQGVTELQVGPAIGDPDGADAAYLAQGRGGTVLRQVLEPAARLVLVGATAHAAALARLGAAAGYRVLVIDPRSALATPARFPAAQVLVGWPDVALGGLALGRRDAVCVLTHEDRFDVPALSVALASPARYVGAMGSLATHRDRLARLRAAGVAEPDLARLRSPIGLDLGGRSATDVALSVLAEILAIRSSSTAAGDATLRHVADGEHHRHGERRRRERGCTTPVAQHSDRDVLRGHDRSR